MPGVSAPRWWQAGLVGSIAMLLGAGGWLAWRFGLQQKLQLAAERESQRSARIFQAFFDNAPDALFIVEIGADDRLRYTGCNPSCETLSGVPMGEVRGKEPAEIFAPEMAQAMEQRYRTCIALGECYVYDEVRTLPIGRLDLHTVLAPVHSPEGKAIMLLGIIRDMTQRKLAYSEQQQASKMEAIGQLTAGIAHDFNNYLQTITSSLDIIAADYLHGPDAQELGQTAHKAASSGAKLVHHLLAFSRQQVLQPRRLSVASLLRETHKLVGASALGPGIRFKMAVEPFTDDIQVDPTQAESCLLNLVLNARDAMPDGGNLVLHARNAGPEDERFGGVGEGRHVLIAVHDTGCGMDEATMTHAFEPFFTTKTFGKGAGLGLSMAQGFCRQSGGDIRIMRGGDVGTRVELWLPAATAAILMEDERDFNLATIGRSTGRVLLVEDEHDVSAALAAVMVSAGFEVVAVTNAADGLMRLLDREPYDAVVADYALRDMPGPDYLARVAGVKPGLPMLLLSGYDLGEIIPPSLPATTRVLRKPIRRSLLLNTLREAIGEIRSRMVA